MGGTLSYLFENNQFVIENYDKKKTFSSFLPGIAGVKGIPIWVFYANRGQGVTSFGIRDKDEPILEFFPANTSYQYVDKYGFRSFVRVDGALYEPFSVALTDDVTRTMRISRGHFTIVEVNRTREISYEVTYFGITNEPIAGLVRKVNVTNLGKEREIEVVDGIANILPSGATTESYKSMSNLMVSWMNVENVENNIPFYRFRASSGDEAEVSLIEKGHFYFSFVEDHTLIQPIIDSEIIFGYDTSLTVPFGLIDKNIASLDLSNQVAVNRVPCGFTPYVKTVEQDASIQIKTVIGHTSNLKLIEERFFKSEFIEKQLNAVDTVLDELVDVVDGKSNFELFDAYIKQNFLDNTLRGGYPLVFGNGSSQKIYHIYSRKHGDPERDYNFFTLSPEFYSQGNGNFRDVNQNRRNDVYFVPEAGLFNVKMFMSLIQLDGYNPLSVKGTTFKLSEIKAHELVDQFVTTDKEHVKSMLMKCFTPGSISMGILLSNIGLTIPEDAFIEKLVEASEQQIEANFGEGFWSDHWTYILDLIENYLKVFPDKCADLLHEDATYRYFDSPVRVLPRSQKYGLTKDGEVRQFGALKEEPHSERFEKTNWVKDHSNHIYETTLAQKLMTLVLTKLSSLDPSGFGIEMEANKPGWNDAMNGLPGVFGSGMSETIELIRVIRFLSKHLSKDVLLCEENYRYYENLNEVLSKNMSSFDRWHAFSTAKEIFRSEVDKEISGVEIEVSVDALKTFLQKAETLLLEGVQKSKKQNEGILPTYFIHKATDYTLLEYKTPYGLQGVQINAFEMEIVPSFLEAPARSFKIGELRENQEQHQLVKGSKLYDEKLNTYKTSVPLDKMSYELGRIRAFTPGWLERESNFLHMTYKYLLGLLKGGLYDVFFEEIKTNLVCFMDPEVYGRSTLENSSFIASSLNPNPKVHGRGFVSRLSGSTAEMLSIWHMMMFGKSLFSYDDVLKFTPKPILSAEFFKDGKVVTQLLSKIEFIIENETGYPTYSEKIDVDYFLVDGHKVERVDGPLAEAIRERKINQVRMVYKIIA